MYISYDVYLVQNTEFRNLENLQNPQPDKPFLPDSSHPPRSTSNGMFFINFSLHSQSWQRKVVIRTTKKYTIVRNIEKKYLFPKRINKYNVRYFKL